MCKISFNMIFLSLDYFGDSTRWSEVTFVGVIVSFCVDKTTKEVGERD